MKEFTDKEEAEKYAEELDQEKIEVFCPAIKAICISGIPAINIFISDDRIKGEFQNEYKCQCWEKAQVIENNRGEYHVKTGKTTEFYFCVCEPYCNHMSMNF